MPAMPAAIGPYQILARLGEGGVGVVYRARHRDTGQEVACKTVRATRMPHLSSVRREIRALQRLQHPGIVRILDEGVHDGRPWYAMELLEGEPLDLRFVRIFASAFKQRGADSTTTIHAPVDDSWRDPPETASSPRRLAAGGRLPEVLTLFRRICAPLAFLHGEGLVHRDFKPSNVYVRPDGTPVLMDFGLAGRREGALGREVLEDASGFVGTVGYISPEQVRGDTEDARTDLYALGCTLFEAITARLPFPGDSNQEIMQKHLHAQAPAPSRFADGVPSALDELVLQLLAKSPRERVGHADDVARKLAAMGAEGWPGGDPVRSAAYLYQPRVVGRRAIIDDVLAALEKTRAGAGGLVLIGGESGIGKTSVAAMVSRIAHRDGIEVVTGACLAPGGEGVERGSPLHPFRPLLQRIAERCVAGGQTTTARVLGRHHRLLATTEPALAQVPGDDGQPEPPPLPAQAARERMLEALGETIRAFADDKALLVVLDDMQWADDLSLALVDLLARRYVATAERRLMLLGTYRSEEVSPGLDALLAKTAPTRIELGRLDGKAVGTMVADMLGLAEAPDDLSRFVARESEGNPFFVAEYLRTALAEKLLDRDAQGRWQRGQEKVTALQLPRNLKALVERRLDGLSEDARALAEVAAVIGREFTPDLLTAVAERDIGVEDRVLAATNELLARQVFVETSTGLLSFVHDKLREVAHEATALERRRALHRLAAEALERRHAGSTRLPLVYPKLAHHHRQAGNFSRAVDYLEKAGLHSLAQSANGDAVAFFEEALRLDTEAHLGSDGLRRARWERLAGDALQGLGKLSSSKDHLRRAVALLGRPEPRTPLGLALSTLFQVARQVWHRLRPGVLRRPVVDSAPLLEAARAYDRLFQVYYFEANPLPLFHANLRTLNLAERVAPSPELASAYSNAFAALSLVPPMRRLAPQYLRRAEETLARVSDPAVESYLELIRAVVLSGSGAWAEADRRLQRVVEIALTLGYRRRWEEATGVRAFNQMLTGAVEEALATAESVGASAARGDTQTQCWSRLERAQARLALGRLDEALVDAREAAGTAAALGRDERIWAQGTLALVAFRRNDLGTARVAAERALAEIAAGPPVMSACVDAYAAVAEVLLALWAANPADRAISRAAARACRALIAFARVFPFARPRAELRLGDLRRLRGRPRGARACWSRARSLAATLGMKADEGLAVLRLAEDDPALHDHGVALLLEGGQRHLASSLSRVAVTG